MHAVSTMTMVERMGSEHHAFEHTQLVRDPTSIAVGSLTARLRLWDWCHAGNRSTCRVAARSAASVGSSVMFNTLCANPNNHGA